MSGTLMLHRGAREVPRDYLAAVPTPPAERRWVPIPHHRFVDSVNNSLRSAGFTVERERYALSREDARLFGVLDLAVEVSPEVKLTVGLRSSLDQSYPLGFCAGHRVFVCDNLSFSAELMAKRKHTALGLSRFQADIGQCVAKLPEFVLAERSRIQRMQRREVTDTEAESLILKAMYDHQLVSHRLAPKLIEAWREAPFPEFEARNAWSLFNAFTLVMAAQQSNPQKHARNTMALQSLVSGFIGLDSPDVIDVTPQFNPLD